MLTLKKNSIILIYCPAKLKTGGTELLHQLAHMLQKKYRCYMVYTESGKGKNPKPEEFGVYKTETAHYVPGKWDTKENILIVPETLTSYLYHFSRIQKCIWWLSVDNYILAKQNLRKDYGMFSNLCLWLNHECFVFGPGQNTIMHLAQSYYAVAYLKKRGITNISYLSDYVNDTYGETSEKTEERQDIVLFNPLKGKEFTKKIINYSSSIHYTPILNMTNLQVKGLMRHSKVYMDFGEHPGKDRLPREAALSGLCVITGKKGAAGNDRDVSIPGEFKFDDRVENIPAITSKIKKCMTDYEKEAAKYAVYLKKIKREKQKFVKDVDRIFNMDI